MRAFTKEFLRDVDQQAKVSPRKRAHLNLHHDYNEKIQRLFISLIEGSFVEPHYHELPHQWEMFVVIEGVVEVSFYSSSGDIVNTIMVGEEHSCRALEIQPYDIHSVKCISPKALMLEIKEGPFEPMNAKTLVDFKVLD